MGPFEGPGVTLGAEDEGGGNEGAADGVSPLSLSTELRIGSTSTAIDGVEPVVSGMGSGCTVFGVGSAELTPA